MATPSLNLLREKFSELTRAEPHLGLNPRAPSLEGGVIHKWPSKLTLSGMTYFPPTKNQVKISIPVHNEIQL